MFRFKRPVAPVQVVPPPAPVNMCFSLMWSLSLGLNGGLMSPVRLHREAGENKRGASGCFLEQERCTKTHVLSGPTCWERTPEALEIRRVLVLLVRFHAVFHLL